MRTLFDPRCRAEVLARFRSLSPKVPPRWGRMTAPQMLTHLSDQMRHTLGDAPCAPIYGPLRWPVIRQLVLYWLPWPRGRGKGPPEAFLTRPTDWGNDLHALVILIERFAAKAAHTSWPEHALFGPMSGRAWGKFCYRHFDYHLRQFGV